MPPRSPYGLIQEDLLPNRWQVLVACMMLNCTSRKQVEKVIVEFFRRWPGPESFLTASDVDVAALCKPLGFSNRRTKNLKAMSTRFVKGDWTGVRELPGIGEYAARAYEIFCLGKLGEMCPNDHALVEYWNWTVNKRNEQ